MLIYKTSLHDALYRHVEENVNPGLVITEPGESNLYFLSGTVVSSGVVTQISLHQCESACGAPEALQLLKR